MIHPAYIADLGRAPLLSAADERELARRIRAGDAEARAALIRANLRLVARIARGYVARGRRVGLDIEDLIGHGNEGLIDAVDRFDPEAHGTRFATFAGHWIRMRIGRALIAQAAPVRIPAHLHEEASRHRKACATAAAAGEPPPEMGPLLAVAEAALSRPVVRIDLDHDGSGASLHGAIPDRRAEAADAEGDRLARVDRLRRAVASLPAAEADLLRRRHALDGHDFETLRSIADRTGVSRDRVRHREVAALRRLAAALGAASLPGGYHGVRDVPGGHQAVLAPKDGGPPLVGPVRGSAEEAAEDYRRFLVDRKRVANRANRAAAGAAILPPGDVATPGVRRVAAGQYRAVVAIGTAARPACSLGPIRPTISAAREDFEVLGLRRRKKAAAK